MDPSPCRRKIRLILLLALPLLVAVPVALVIHRRQEDAQRNAARAQSILDHGAAGATALRIWGAGQRTSSGFCPCAVVPKPERVIYETRDPAEIREFASLLRARPHLEPDPLCRCCGTIAIDFLRGEDILRTSGAVAVETLDPRASPPGDTQSIDRAAGASLAGRRPSA